MEPLLIVGVVLGLLALSKASGAPASSSTVGAALGVQPLPPPAPVPPADALPSRPFPPAPQPPTALPDPAKAIEQGAGTVVAVAGGAAALLGGGGLAVAAGALPGAGAIAGAGSALGGLASSAGLTGLAGAATATGVLIPVAVLAGAATYAVKDLNALAYGLNGGAYSAAWKRVGELLGMPAEKAAAGGVTEAQWNAAWEVIERENAATYVSIMKKPRGFGVGDAYHLRYHIERGEVIADDRVERGGELKFRGKRWDWRQGETPVFVPRVITKEENDARLAAELAARKAREAQLLEETTVKRKTTTTTRRGIE